VGCPRNDARLDRARFVPDEVVHQGLWRHSRPGLCMPWPGMAQVDPECRGDL